jgi:hypothetical protein
MNFVPRFRALAIAALSTVSLPAIALAQSVTVTDIAIDGGSFDVSIPTIEVTGSDLDEAAIRAIFSGTIKDAATALATIDADAIAIPTMTITSVQSSAGIEIKSTATYSGFELTGITDGVASSATLASTESTTESPAPTGTITMTMGRMSAGLFDLGAFAGFYGYAEPTDEYSPVYADFAVDGMTMSGPQFSCTVGPVSAEEFRLRPLKVTIDDLMKFTAELQAAENGDTMPSPEAMKAAITYYIDLLTAFESSPTVVDGLDCSAIDEKGKPVTIDGGALTIGGFQPGIYPDISMAGLRVEVADDGWIEFDDFTWKEMDLNGPIEVLRDNLDNLDAAWFDANWRRLIPDLAGLSIEGFAADVPSDGTAQPRVQLSVASFDVSLADYVNGIPSTIASHATDVAVSAPPEAQAMLTALGVEKLNMGYNLALKWDEPTRTIAVEDLTVTGDQFGTISLSGTLGNAGPELFAPTNEIAMAAAMSMTVKELTVSIDNQGFVPAIIAAAAAEQKAPPEALHLAFTGMAQAMPLALLGASEDAKGLSTALGAFFAGAPRINVTITAVDPNGIGLPELMAAQENPALLQGKVTIVAAAEGEPVPFVFPDLSGVVMQDATPGAVIAPEPEPEVVPEIAPPVDAAPAEGPTRAEDKAGNKQ